MGSPIEDTMRIALLELSPKLVTVDLTHVGIVEFETDDLLRLHPSFEVSNHGWWDDIYLFAQARCLGYRTDLMLWSTSASLAIECDGHDYHERTQQQAAYDRARDRELTRAGATVTRFTGSEIYRDAEQCARDVASTWRVLSERWQRLRSHWAFYYSLYEATEETLKVLGRSSSEVQDLLERKGRI